MLVVDGVHEVDAVAERREPLPGDREGVGVAVDADERELGEAREHRLGVAAHAERGVDEHGARRARARARAARACARA